MSIDSVDDALPPVVTCARCRKPECSGCESERARLVEPNLAWEGPGSWTRRLWQTSLEASTDPENTFGRLSDARLSSAVVFAFVAESLAIGSLAILASIAAYAWAPSLVVNALRDSSARWLGMEVYLAALVSFVAMHAVWGLCIESGNAASGGHPRWRLGMRFGLYACGWDLLTSPAGILHGLAMRGPKGAFGPISAAAHAARPAMRAYMIRNREFDSRAQRRATFITGAVLGTTLLLLTFGSLTFAIRVALARG